MIAASQLPGVRDDLVRLCGTRGLIGSILNALWGPALTPDKQPGVLVVTWADASGLIDWQQRHEGLPAETAQLMRSSGPLA